MSDDEYWERWRGSGRRSVAAAFQLSLLDTYTRRGDAAAIEALLHAIVNGGELPEGPPWDDNTPIDFGVF